MTFESFIEAQSFFLWSTFIIALIMGAIVNKTNFCTMGAVSDLVNIGDSGRFRAWLLAIAMAVLGAWYVTSNIQIDADGELMSLSGYYDQWDMYADSNEGKPSQGRPLSPQSFTFISPMGQTVGYAAGKFNPSLLTFGVMAFLGVLGGSLLWSLLSRSFRIEWFSSFGDFVNHLVGAILMGFGGVLALGCTIGQGITGISTLALGSFLTFGAIVLGSALTMKVQYYHMVYEAEAGFGKALVASLADMHLLPDALRRLDKV